MRNVTILSVAVVVFGPMGAYGWVHRPVPTPMADPIPMVTIANSVTLPPDKLHEAHRLAFIKACRMYGGVDSVCDEEAKYYADEMARKDDGDDVGVGK